MIVHITCPECEQVAHSDEKFCHVFICREDGRYNKIAFRCERCGDALAPLTLDGFYELQTRSSVPVSYFTKAEVREQQAQVLREFSDRLDDTLAAILGGAA